MHRLRNTTCKSAMLALAVAIGFGPTLARGEDGAAPARKPATFRTAAVTRGDLLVTVSASGTLEPREVVDVSPQVAGVIEKFGPDPRGATDPNYKDKSIDFRTPVEVGTLLAQIDDTSYRSRVERERAAVARAQAEVEQDKAALDLAAAELRRAQDGAKNKSVATSELQSAQLKLKLAQAASAVAEAGVAQARTVLDEAQVNLKHTQVRSPVKGVVIDVRANVGQTVGAALSAPSLFLIAKDLDHLQVWASVNEADIGHVHENQPVRFTVDAFPDKVFHGVVTQVRLNGVMLQNVVSYTVVIAVDDSEGTLLPYLTANVELETARHKNVLLVPNAALRWRPQSPPGAGEGDGAQKQARSRVWLEDAGSARPVEVQTGATDGSNTEITGGDLKEDMRVIVGTAMPAEDAGLDLPAPLRRAVAAMGPNNLLIFPGQSSANGVLLPAGTATLTAGDADEIARRCPALAAVAPVVRGRGQVVYGDRNWVPQLLYGTTPQFLSVRGREEQDEGRSFTDDEVRSAADVCVLGRTVARALFGGDSPVDKEVRVQGVPVRVLGVLRRVGPNLMGWDDDDVVLMPWTTVSRHAAFASTASGGAPNAANDSAPNRYPARPSAEGTDRMPRPTPVRIDHIVANASSSQERPAAIEQIRDVLRRRHRPRDGQPDDFVIRDMSEFIKALVATQRLRQSQLPGGAGPR